MDFLIYMKLLELSTWIDHSVESVEIIYLTFYSIPFGNKTNIKFLTENKMLTQDANDRKMVENASTKIQLS